MISRRGFMASLPVAVAGGAAAAGREGTGEEPIDLNIVTRVVVYKDARKMFLLNAEKKALKGYDIDLGFEPVGHKTKYGDGRTPEGDYLINRRNPHSRFHLSLGISYPDRNDLSAARKAGLNPGGNIFIHGRGPRFRWARGDWTWGCIAVKDREMEEIFEMVSVGTVISIYP